MVVRELKEILPIDFNTISYGPHNSYDLRKWRFLHCMRAVPPAGVGQARD